MFEYYCEKCDIKEFHFGIIPFKKCPECEKLMFVEEPEEGQ